MKYLAYFQPSPELSNLIQNQDHTLIPTSGLHTTLCSFHMELEQESSLIRDLAKTYYSPFEVETQEIDIFDKESIVLKLTRPPELYQLHEDIVQIVKRCANPEFNERYSRYFGPRYNPHITISKTSTPFDTTNTLNTSHQTLTGHTFRVEQFYLAKKQNDRWTNLGNFPSSRS